MSVAYWGSKKRFASQIADWICEYAANSGRGRETYYEPFCGMASVGMEVLKRGCFSKVVFSDSNGDVITYWKGVKSGWLPRAAPISTGRRARPSRACGAART